MKILFCSDGSSKAENAIRFGSQIAISCKAESTILGIAEKKGDEEALQETLKQSQKILAEQNLDSQVITEVGKPVTEIAKHCKQTAYDLVVVGAARKSTFWRLFDTRGMSVGIHKILESVESPVLVVIGDRPDLRRILVCTGGSAYMEKAVNFVGNLAQCVKAAVDLFHVMPEMPVMYADLFHGEIDAKRLIESNSKLGRTLRRQKELLEQLEVFGEFRLRQGEAVAELLKELAQTDYDLVVAGSPPVEETLSRFVMSDITREIVNRAMLPVLIIRTRQRRIRRFFKDILSRLFGTPPKAPDSSAG